MSNKYVSITYAKLKEWEGKAVIDPYSLKLSVKEQDLMDQVRTSLGISSAEPIPVLNEPTPVEQKMNRIKVWQQTAGIVFGISHMPMRVGNVPGLSWIGHPPTNPSGKALVDINLNHPELMAMGITEDCFRGNGKPMFYTTKEIRRMMGFKTDNPIYRRFGGVGEHIKIGSVRRYPRSLVEQKVQEHWSSRVQPTPLVLAE